MMCVSGSTHGLCVPLLASGQVEPGYRSVEQRLEFDVEAPLSPKTVDAMHAMLGNFQYIHRIFGLENPLNGGMQCIPMHETNTRNRRPGDGKPVDLGRSLEPLYTSPSMSRDAGELQPYLWPRCTSWRGKVVASGGPVRRRDDAQGFCGPRVAGETLHQPGGWDQYLFAVG